MRLSRAMTLLWSVRPPTICKRLLERGVGPAFALAGIGSRRLAEVFQERVHELAVRHLGRPRPRRAG